MTEQNIKQKFRLREVDKNRNYFIEERKQNEVISKKQKSICKILNHIRYLLI